MNLNENFKYLHVGLPEDVQRQKLHGDFEGAIESIDRYLKQEIPKEMKGCLTAQREMILRLPMDYPLRVEEAIQQGKKKFSDFSEMEFDQLMEEGRIDWIYDHGTIHVFDRWMETLCKTDENYAKRAGVPWGADGQDADSRLDKVIARMKKEGSVSARISCQASVRLKDEMFQKGVQVWAYLPLPCAVDAQSDICIESITPEPTMIMGEDAPQRMVCWSEEMQENHAFTVRFSYTRTARYVDLTKHIETVETESVQRWESSNAKIPGEQQLTAANHEQLPHIRFTPLVQAVTRQLTEGVIDPLQKARNIYDFITQNIKYSFMPAYFGLENIPERCLRTGYGDCGVLALTFITLCRCAGIPARWESGWKAEPDNCGAHDWAQFYIAPYGWLYADPSFGCGAVRAGNEERRQFYFGNLDPYRMSANTAFQEICNVPIKGWRADPYDNQVGEMEVDGRGLPYEEFERNKEVLGFEFL